jgi:hypothetical protein
MLINLVRSGQCRGRSHYVQGAIIKPEVVIFDVYCGHFSGCGAGLE